MNIKRIVGIAALSLAGITVQTSAATTSTTFQNDFAATSIFLWAESVNVAFTLPSLTTPTPLKFVTGMNGWTIATLAPSKIQLNGPQIAPQAGKFKVSFTFSTSRKFDIQWAEVLFNGTTTVLQGAGGLTYDNLTPGHVVWSDNHHPFTHMNELGLTAVPLPGSLVLLLSALVFVPTVGGRRLQRA